MVSCPTCASKQSLTQPQAFQSKKRLALAILDFLQTSQTDGSVAPDDAEQLEVAANCIAEAFKVDPADEAAKKDAIGDQNLLAIYNVYEKLKGKTTATTEGSSSAKEARPATPQTPAAGSGPGGPNKDEAERLKGLGNEAMKKKDYDSAVKHYTAALDVIPLNPIYLSNRAAAYSGQGKHELAKEDAEMAVAADPNYSKAWSRLGLAKYVLGDAKGAMEAYKSGMDAEGGGSEVMRKGYETAKKKVEEEGGDVGAPDAGTSRGTPGGMGGGGGMPDLSALAGMLGGGGGGGGGGMPDLAGLMQNPMMRQMAQNLMSNPDMMSNLMNNPRIAEMAQQFGGGGGRGAGNGGSGGGMPNMQDLMNDPNLAEM
jgi:small glutamine-rich tetratricopeptide repeat-containing protein alpha